MQSLLLLLLRYGHVILFLILETFCFYLIINNNEYQRSVFIHSSNELSGSMLQKVSQWNNYFHLQTINDSLANENARLKEKLFYLKDIQSFQFDSSFLREDTTISVIPARVINNTIHLQNNYITLNKGLKDSIEARMGVVSENGVVGVIEHVSENFATVLPFLNTRSRIRGKITRNDAIGTVSWDGRSVDQLMLEGIPKHLSIQIGDTVVTSGFSTIFPEGQMIGKVTEINLPRGSNTYQIMLKTPVSMGQLRYVYIIKNNKQKERLELESRSE